MRITDTNGGYNLDPSEGVSFRPGTSQKTITEPSSVTIPKPPDAATETKKKGVSIQTRFGDDANGSREGISFRPGTSQTTTTAKPSMPRPPARAPRFQETSAAGSAAAPRRKVAFNGKTQGSKFGLVQWNRLVRTSRDLAQRKGAPYRKAIPWEEIRRHNQPHDCWMVFQGVVYNIGPYLAYHPGGIEIFSKHNLLGEDGTKLFDKYHPWVSLEGLIGTLAIGSVEPPVGADPEAASSNLGSFVGTALDSVAEF